MKAIFPPITDPMIKMQIKKPMIFGVSVYSSLITLLPPFYNASNAAAPPISGSKAGIPPSHAGGEGM